MKAFILCTLMSVTLNGALKAVSSDPGPMEFTVSSSNGKYEAIHQPGEGFKCKELSSGSLIWKSRSPWYRGAVLSDDGRKLVAFFENGIALEDLSQTDKFTPLTFFKDGKIVRKIKITDLISNLETLERRNTYYYWGDVIGFTKEGLFEVRIKEKETLFFDPDTGEISKRIPFDGGGGNK